MNLYEQQASNRRKTWLIMAAFILLLFFLGFGFKPAELFEITTVAERDAPVVDLSRR